MLVSTNPGGFDPITDLFLTLAQKVNPPLSSGTQRDQARAEGKRDGYMEGVCEGITSILNGRRCEKLKHWETVPLIEYFHVRKIVSEFITLYQAAAPDKSFPTKESYAEKRKAENAVVENFVTAINALVIDEDIAESEFQRHKKAVLAGTEQPTAADAEWVREEMETMRAVLTPLQTLLEKIDPDNLRTRRAIKDQPQA